MALVKIQIAERNAKTFIGHKDEDKKHATQLHLSI